MKIQLLPLLFGIVYLSSCKTNVKEEIAIPIKGTWKLVSSVTVSKGKRTVTDYTKDQEMIKIISDDHFSFLRHDLKLNGQGQNNFDAGGGRYQLNGNQYTEYLDYYKDPVWEGKVFTFQVKIQHDSLIQTGIEKVEKAGVNRTITETYVRVKI